MYRIDIINPNEIKEMKIGDVFNNSLKDIYVISDRDTDSIYQYDLAELEDILTNPDEYRIIKIIEE